MLLLAIIFAIGLVLLASVYWRQLGDQGPEPSAEGRLYFRWMATGLLVPLILWLGFNLGLLGAPVWPTVSPVTIGFLAWWNTFHGPASAGVFLISSYWAGITFAWLLWRVFERVENHRAFAAIVLSWSLLLVPAAAVLIFFGKWPAVGMVLMLAALALVHTTLALTEEKPLAPSYARAQAKINFGKYEEAEMEVIQELEQCEEDFDGWMMLAELYATNFHDLAAADQTVRDLCEQPSTTAPQVAIALNRLADWHLKLAHDPVAAGNVLEQLCRRLPGTHLEKMARQRLNQLPATREELLARERGKPLRLPHMPDEPGAARPRLPRDQALREANDCVAALTRNPDDLPTREKFAHLLGDSLDERNTAIEQLQLLLVLGGQPANKRAEWMLAIAGWHAAENMAAARLVYEEVVRDFPETIHAFAAQRRLNLMDLQARLGRRALNI